MTGRSRRIGAFTILEILASMAVLALLLVVLVGIVDRSAQLWKEKQSQTDASREARAALQMMAGDARTLLRSADAQTLYLPGGAAERLAMLTLQPEDAQRTGNRSDLCTVGYFVAYDSPSRFGASAPNSRNLYRYLRGSDDTFACLEAGGDVFAEFDEVAAMAGPSRHRNVTLLARNVNRVNFEAYALSPEGDPMLAATDDPAAIGVEIFVVPTNLVARLDDESAWLALPGEKQLACSTLLRTPVLP